MKERKGTNQQYQEQEVITINPTDNENVMRIFYFLIFLMFIYFWERDTHTHNTSGRGAERERERRRGRHRIQSRLWAVSTRPDAGLELTKCEIMTWAEVGHLTDWATQAPVLWGYFNDSMPINLKILMKWQINWKTQLAKFYSRQYKE